MLEILVVLSYLFVGLFIILKMDFFKITGVHTSYLVAVFLLKCGFGFLLYYVYSHMYTDRATADIFKYFDDSKVMYDALWHSPLDYLKMVTGIGNDTAYFSAYYNDMNHWYRAYETTSYNDNHTIIRFNAVVRLFSFGFYHVHTLVMNFISFVGLVYLYKFFQPYFKGTSIFLFIAIFLVPSLLFWGSGVLKEGLLILGLGMLLYYVGALLTAKKIIVSVVGIFMAFLLLRYTKVYVLALIFPLLIAFMINLRYQIKYPVVTYLSLFIGYIFAAFWLNEWYYQVDIWQTIAQKQYDFISLALSLKAGSYVAIPILSPSFIGVLEHVPNAFLYAFTYPTIFFSSSLLVKVAAVENLMVLVVLCVALLFRKKTRYDWNLMWFLIFFLVLIFTLIGLITPVVGALVRYKAPFLSFLLVLCFYMMDTDRIVDFIKRINN